MIGSNDELYCYEWYRGYDIFVESSSYGFYGVVQREGADSYYTKDMIEGEACFTACKQYVDRREDECLDV